MMKPGCEPEMLWMGRAGACWLSPRTEQHRCQTEGWRRGVLEREAQRWLGGLGRHRWVLPPCSRTLCYCCHRQGSPRAEIMATKLQASCPEGHPGSATGCSARHSLHSHGRKPAFLFLQMPAGQLLCTFPLPPGLVSSHRGVGTITCTRACAHAHTPSPRSYGSAPRPPHLERLHSAEDVEGRHKGHVFPFSTHKETLTVGILKKKSSKALTPQAHSGYGLSAAPARG